MDLNNAENRIANDLVKEIDSLLSKAGLFYRIFGRVKTQDSIINKIEKKSYSENDKKLQDLIGIRITLYFADDLKLIEEILKRNPENRFTFVDETIDKPEEDEFKPSRINLIFRLPTELSKQLDLIKKIKEIDNTFEIQLRTVLSEGWHEVEHDLRYKCREEWQDEIDLSRTLNGVFATLETCDWTMLSIFDELAYRHYKKNNWQAMLRNKFRIRFDKTPLSRELIEILDNNKEIGKRILRYNRSHLLKQFYENDLSLPILFSNLIFLINYLHLKNDQIERLTPSPIYEEFKNKFGT